MELSRSRELVIPLAVGLVFLGCCSNVVFLELLIREDPGAGNIITFLQFAFIALEGLVMHSNFFQKKPVIPVSKYMTLVFLYAIVSIINNYALNFNIPLPLHMIFRAGSLMANLILGMIILGRTYTISKYVAVVMITIGISTATIASAQMMQRDESPQDSDSDKETTVTGLVVLSIGISMLLFALFCSAIMGIFQEKLYSQHGKHPRESMFYTHLLPLPGFLILAPDIWNKVVSFTASEAITIGIISVPKMWVYILGNLVTQYVCIRGVFILTTECPSLIVTLVVTLRKFASLLFSIFYFQNPFTFYHWIGTLLVFLGTALFTGILNPLLRQFVPPSKPKKE